MTLGYDITAHVTRFCRALRDYGLLVGPKESTDALRAVDIVGLPDQRHVYWALRSVLVSRREDIPVFDQLFSRFWDFDPPPRRKAHGPGGDQLGKMREFRPEPGAFLQPKHDPHSGNTFLQVFPTGASAEEAKRERDLGVLGVEELSELSRIASRTVRALASRPGRRTRRHRRKGVPDLRGIMRLNLATGGDPIRLPRRRRVPRVPRLVVLLDVSGSMDRHAKLLLHLAYSVGQHTSRVETFVFSTSVTRVTHQLKAPSFSEALRRVGGVVHHWASGTRIGESLGRLSSEYEALFNRYTTVLLLSDGWDTGEPDKLAWEVRRIRRRVRRFVWLNPLMQTEGYEPLTRGLVAVRPYVDTFVAAGDVQQLKRLPQLVRR
ncbi:MAG: VWA domain-containing protein [SAR202 cluster bacterium]|nr:VWA domain-containing protein [SAR202 cluster bacterium]